MIKCIKNLFKKYEPTGRIGYINKTLYGSKTFSFEILYFDVIFEVEEIEKINDTFSKIKILDISGCPESGKDSAKEILGNIINTNEINWK